MTPETEQATNRQQILATALEVKRVRDDNLYFLENYVWTLDSDASDAVKKFPSRKERPDLYELAEKWNEVQILLIEKSRQLMATWLFVSLYLHRTCFHRGRLCFFQSKKQDDARKLLDRAWFIYRRLPPFLKTAHQKLADELKFPSLDSWIWAIPEGGDHIRSYTASGLLTDEAAFQPEFESAYTAALASIGSEGKMTIPSTPNGPNFFYRLSKDKVGRR